MATTTAPLPGLQRTQDGRLVAGVCRGAADHFGVDVRILRFCVLLLCAAAGAGAIAYGVAWATLPLSGTATDSDVGAAEAARREQRRRNVDVAESIAVLLVALGALVMLRSLGMWFTDTSAVVAGAAAIGLTLVWGDANGPTEFGDRRPLRIAIGVVLLIAGVVALVVSSGDFDTVSRTLVATGLAAAGVALLFGPYLARLSDELDTERRSRIRFEERAEIAAHLHDGVLQTLAMVQKRADDPREVARLARRQERELRDWLHSTTPTGARTAASTWDAPADTARHGAPNGAEGAPVHTLQLRLKTLLADVEDDHGMRVELVVVGDCPLDDRASALAAAVREAANNARHAGVAVVDVFVEVEHDSIAAFVRDRGAGFDVEAVDSDRRGVADSIVGRIERAGGTAVVNSSPGRGTEVKITVPRSPNIQQPDAAQANSQTESNGPET